MTERLVLVDWFQAAAETANVLNSLHQDLRAPRVNMLDAELSATSRIISCLHAERALSIQNTSNHIHSINALIDTRAIWHGRYPTGSFSFNGYSVNVRTVSVLLISRSSSAEMPTCRPIRSSRASNRSETRLGAIETGVSHCLQTPLTLSQMISAAFRSSPQGRLALRSRRSLSLLWWPMRLCSSQSHRHQVRFRAAAHADLVQPFRSLLQRHHRLLVWILPPRPSSRSPSLLVATAATIRSFRSHRLRLSWLSMLVLFEAGSRLHRPSARCPSTNLCCRATRWLSMIYCRQRTSSLTSLHHRLTSSLTSFCHRPTNLLSPVRRRPRSDARPRRRRPRRPVRRRRRPPCPRPPSCSRQVSKLSRQLRSRTDCDQSTNIV